MERMGDTEYDSHGVHGGVECVDNIECVDIIGSVDDDTEWLH